jgi:phospholipid/cholesterol/gamma-HCH transport system substrate-binding protein
MGNNKINNLKSGIFVLAGLVFLIMLLFLIGRNKNLFGNNYRLKARFEHVQGLVVGNNVRYSGIQIGTVSNIRIINDTVIEITMLIDKKMKPIIKQNAIAGIGTDGLVGNKVINIQPGKSGAPAANEDDTIDTRKVVDTDDMIQTLAKTNEDIAEIAMNLKKTIQNINNSNALWSLLNDQTIPDAVKMAASNLKSATEKASSLAGKLESVITAVQHGEGSVGKLLKDTAFVQNLNSTVLKIRDIGDQANELSDNLKNVISGIQQDVVNGRGAVHALLKDTAIVQKLAMSMNNIQKGTDDFSKNMEALKHNILFRGYFKKLEKKAGKTNPAQ